MVHTVDVNLCFDCVKHRVFSVSSGIDKKWRERVLLLDLQSQSSWHLQLHSSGQRNKEKAFL